jgi:hypothetical protein
LGQKGEPVQCGSGVSSGKGGSFKWERWEREARNVRWVRLVKWDGVLKSWKVGRRIRGGRQVILFHVFSHFLFVGVLSMTGQDFLQKLYVYCTGQDNNTS